MTGESTEGAIGHTPVEARPILGAKSGGTGTKSAGTAEARMGPVGQAHGAYKSEYCRRCGGLVHH